MKIAVCVKWVADLDSVDVDPIHGQVDASRLLHVLDPGAESALALALALATSAGQARGVYVYTVGRADADAALRIALAAGAPSVLRIDAEPRPALTAALLAQALEADGPFDLVLLGTRSSDHASGEVPSLLAAALSLPVVTDVTALAKGAEGGWEAERESLRGAREVVAVRGAAVIALGPDVMRLGTASLPALLEAQRATLTVRRETATPLATDPVILARSELPARPRALVLRAPAGSPDERLASITQGAQGTRTRGRLLEGPPGEMAEAIVTFLRERGLLDADP